jgi:hypothetical protein
MTREISFPEEMCLLVEFLEDVIGMSSTPRQYSTLPYLTHGDMELLSARMASDEPRAFGAEVSEMATRKNIRFEAAYALLMDYLDTSNELEDEACK